jgi:hypothetical protein
MAKVLCICLVPAAFVPAEANTFLARDPPSLIEDGDLLKNLSVLLGSRQAAVMESRVDRLEEVIRPTFRAIPRDSEERIDATSVRYLLHRVFVDRHGWFVEGLHNRGDAWNSSSPSALFSDHADGSIGRMLDDRFSEGGYNLRQVALLAATLESFVHMESVERLHASYRLHGLERQEDSATEAQVLEVMATYMQLYVLGLPHETVSKPKLDKIRLKMSDIYPNWDETLQWVSSIRSEVLRTGVGPSTSFNTTMQVLEEIAERYGRWQNRECLHIKDSLTKLEEPGTGRVRLSEFYRSALDGNWQFSESQSYLRQLGALDEEDARSPSVIIPNYVNAPSNCVASSKFYSVCCIDECEALLGHIEHDVAAPEASPARLIELVQNLPSSTVKSPRVLPSSLTQRLEEIGAQHGGKVPLHGRLFSQWLHHAYPRECQYPHIAGTSKPATVEEWTKQTGEKAVADESTMRWHVQEAAQSASHRSIVRGGEELPWSAEEELFVSRPRGFDDDGAWGLLCAARRLAMLAAACSMAWAVVQAARTVPSGQPSCKSAKYMV